MAFFSHLTSRTHQDLPLKFTRLFVQIFIFAVSVTIIGLIGRGFKILNDREDQVSAIFPNGELHSRPIFASALTFALVAGVCWICSIINIFWNQSQGGLKSLYMKFLWIISIFFVLPSLLAVTIIGASKSGYITSDLPEILVTQILLASGQSLDYKDIGVVIGFIVMGWILFVVFLIGAMLENRVRRVYPVMIKEKGVANQTLVAEAPINNNMENINNENSAHV